MVYFIVFSCRIYICNSFEGHRVISVLGLLLSVLSSLNKAYYYFIIINAGLAQMSSSRRWGRQHSLSNK